LVLLDLKEYTDSDLTLITKSLNQKRRNQFFTGFVHSCLTFKPIISILLFLRSYIYNQYDIPRIKKPLLQNLRAASK